MWYSFVCTDNTNSLARRLKTRPQHLARLKELQNAGRLLVAGPNPRVESSQLTDDGFTGSIIIAEFPDLNAAQHWAEQDPYNLEGVYSSVEIKPFIKVLP